MTDIVQTDPSTSQLKKLAEYGEAQLGDPNSVAPLSFMDIDEKGNPIEVKMEIRTKDLVSGIDSIGESALARTTTYWASLSIADRMMLKGYYGSESDAKAMISDRFGRMISDAILGGKEQMTVDTANNVINAGKIKLTNVTVDGQKDMKKINMNPVKSTGIFGRVVATT